MADPTNTEIAAALDELGDLYELDGAIIHRIVAYRNAAKAVRDAPVSVTALARQGRASELPGVGAIIQEKVLALADDGAIPAAVKLRAKFPPGLIEITRLPGTRAQARAAAVRRARDRFARGAAPGRRAAQDPHAERVRTEGRGEPPRCPERRRRRRAPRPRRARPGARRRRAADRSCCAGTPLPSASSSAARPGG